MRLSTLSCFIAVTIFSLPAFSTELSCVRDNDKGIYVIDTGSSYEISIEDIGGHSIAETLGLPDAGKPYRYVRAELSFKRTECVFSRDGMKFFCNGSQLPLVFTFPAASVQLRFADLEMHKLTTDSIRHGVWTGYKIRLFSRDQASDIVLSPEWEFEADSCRSAF